MLQSSYLMDWLTAVSLWIASALVSQVPIYERGFSLDDVAISLPHKKSQIGSGLNHLISFWVPVAIVLIVYARQKSVIDVHHALLAAVAGSGLSRLVTEFLKNRVGRLRPDFISRCEWDAALQSCTGSNSEVQGGRKSFPSGHSATSFAGMTFCSLYLLSQVSILSASSSYSFLSSKLARLVLCILPLFYASWVALSRVEDNRHHIEDILVGSIIGFVSSMSCFSVYWHNPLFSHTPGPRSVYVDDPNEPDYEIASSNEA